MTTLCYNRIRICVWLVFLGALCLTNGITWSRTRSISPDTEESSDSIQYHAAVSAMAISNGWSVSDDFSSNTAQMTSCIQSLFVYAGQNAAQPTLGYEWQGSSQKLAMVGYDAEPALLGYCTPQGRFENYQVLRASLSLDMSTRGGNAYLYVSYSSDARHWSTPQSLSSGNNQLELGPMVGRGFVLLLGNNVFIDNLNIVIGRPAATRFVNSGNSIQTVINQASYGDVIEVAPGTYSGNINLGNKAIVLRSQAGASQTQIVCGSGQRGIYVPSDSSGSAVIEGFTILQGDQTIGGGIYCEQSSPLIVGCIIENCEAEQGAGLACVGGNPRIAQCKFENNRASNNGGGMALLQSSHPLMEYCHVQANQASRGAGVYIDDNSVYSSNNSPTITIRDCTIASNQASSMGGGLYATGTYLYALVTQCTITSNSANQGAAFYGSSVGSYWDSIWNTKIRNCTVADNSSLSAVVHAQSGRIQVKNTIIWQNSGNSLSLGSQSQVCYSNIAGGYSGEGNLNQSPYFVSGMTPQGDFSSYLLASYSPCIDAGDPYCSVGAEPSPNGHCINMGAFGGTFVATQGADVIHVNGSIGYDYSVGSSRSSAFQTIGRAVDSTYSGDVVLVWPGVYHESIDMPNHAIKIKGVTDPPVVIGGSKTAFSFSKQQGPDTVLRHLIITQSDRAIDCKYSQPTLANLSIVGNTGGIVVQNPPQPDIFNCIVWGNSYGLWGSSARYSCIQPGYNVPLGEGGFSDDPGFVGADFGDYHLKSWGGRYDSSAGQWTTDFAMSSCIDAGLSETSVSQEPQPHGGRVNIGAYGGTIYASMAQSSYDPTSNQLVAWLHILPVIAETYAVE